jgi:hypothetical protein
MKQALQQAVGRGDAGAAAQVAQVLRDQVLLLQRLEQLLEG